MSNLHIRIQSINKFLPLIFFILFPLQLSAQDEDILSNILKQQPEVKSIVSLKNNVFPEKYIVKILQETDWENKSAGTFEERIIVGFRGYDRPTVIVTEGYFADYALSPYYEEYFTTRLL